MASLTGGDMDRSVRQLGDGFTALRNEYKALAEQHSDLRTHLEDARKQVSHDLRHILPAQSLSMMIQLSSRPVAANAVVTDNNHNYLISLPSLLFCCQRSSEPVTD